MEPCAIMLEYLFFDFAPFGSSEIVSSQGEISVGTLDFHLALLILWPCL